MTWSTQADRSQHRRSRWPEGCSLGDHRDRGRTVLSLGSMPTDFDRGNIRTNAERHNDGDSAWSVFKSLQFQVSGSGNTWFPFVDLKPVAPNAVGDDPVYNCIRVSDQEERVSADPRTC